ncbi:MAG: hypothetical protein M3Y24_08015 [Acidobacteriota bacterium]|nr:hypothetical protein [Acidobacteriota bacterium]
MKAAWAGRRAVVARLLLCSAAALPAISQVTSPAFPDITGETLSGQSVSLPSAATGRLAILCIGFSHGSQTHVKKWAEESRKRFDKDSIPVYTVAVLEDAPRFVRPMAVRGMKSSTPTDQRDRFIVVYSKENELKQAVQFTNSAESYVVLLDAAGHVAWRHAGEVSEAAVRDLSSRMRTLQRAAHGKNDYLIRRS